MSLHSTRAMRFLKVNATLPYSLSNYSRSFLPLFSTVSSPTQASSAEPIPIVDYLNTHLKFSEASSIYVSKRASGARRPQQPLHVMTFLNQVGFSEADIQSVVRQKPQILFADINRILKPKIEYFQKLGFEGSDLVKLLSKNSHLLILSLSKTLVPSVETIRKIVNNEKDLIKLLLRYGNWIIPKHRKLLRTAAFFQSCGIVGSQLTLLLKRQPRLFATQESCLQNLASRAVNMGFHVSSRMWVRAILTMSHMSGETLERKLEFIQSCGFSKDETMQMVRRKPMLLEISEKKLKFGIHVCLDTIMLPKSLLVNNPVILMLSMEKRVIPRWRVLQMLKSKKLLKKNPSFLAAFVSKEENFLENYISKFSGNEEALLKAYKGHYGEDACT